MIFYRIFRRLKPRLFNLRYFFSERDVEQMVVSDKDLQVYGDKCVTKQCMESCEDVVNYRLIIGNKESVLLLNFQACQLCNKCLKKRMALSIRQAYLEHLSRRNMRRIIPAPVSVKARPAYNPTKQDILMELWFKGKCEQDESWCR